MGFPIRKSSDQSLFAAPRSLTQRTTSFIACMRQGIHQMPFQTLDLSPRPRTIIITVQDRSFIDTHVCLRSAFKRHCAHSTVIGVTGCESDKLHISRPQGTRFPRDQVVRRVSLTNKGPKPCRRVRFVWLMTFPKVRDKPIL